MKNFTKEITIPLVLFISFFIIQLFFYPSEIILTIILLIFSAIVIGLKRNRGEWKVVIAGLLIGSFIEVGLGIVGRGDYWNGASLYGIPYWLPIAWGIGFLIITRVGVRLRGLRKY